MEMEYGCNKHKEIIYSQAFKTGKRTYFFDVKERKNGEKYLTITESRKMFLNDDGKFVYEKSKLFLYKEDYEQFMKVLENVMTFTETGIASDISNEYLIDEDSDLDEKINSI